jgi:hypothetical protein
LRCGSAAQCVNSNVAPNRSRLSLLTATLAFLHIAFGMNFFGAVFVLNFVLGPVVLAVSPATLTEFFTKFWPAMKRFLHASIGGTAVFGLLLYAAGDFRGVTGNAALYLDAGVLLGLLAMVEAEALQIPAATKLVRSSAGNTGQSLTPEQKKAFDRIKTGGIIGSITIILSVIFMVASAWA